MSGLIHWAQPVGDDWDQVLAELTRAFHATRSAAQEGSPVVYLVGTRHLLGRDGAGNAMVATGLISAARTAALEGARTGWTVNVVAYDEDRRQEAATWAERLLDSQGVTGEVLRVGTEHLGKALP